MERTEFTGHISGRYNRSLEELFNQVLQMGGLVETQIANALEAIKVENKSLAKEVKQIDKLVNKEEIEIDRICAKVLATQQPTASDLRLVVSAIRIAVDLERAGDEAVNVSKLAIMMSKDSEIPSETLAGYSELLQMIAISQDMLSNTLKCFSELEISYGVDIPEDELRVNELRDNALAKVHQALNSLASDNAEYTMQMIYSIRAAERIAAHIVNITESIIYLINGRNVRNMNSQKLTAFLQESVD